MARLALVAALFCASGVAAWAEPPRTSPLPLPRPQIMARIASLPVPAARPIAPEAIVAALAQAVSSAAPARSPRPAPRPRGAAAPAPLVAPAVTVATASALAPAQSPPAPRRGLAALFAPRPAKPARGSVCGDPAISGAEIAVIPAAARGCGLSGGVAVTAVAGIPLSQPAQIDCTTAKALKTWVEDGVIPAIGRKGGGLARLDVVASYTCRPRNNVPGARVSEHGAGHAVDVAGFTLANGSTLTVARDWGRETKIMRAIHASACGPFGTVLGPRSDANHQDHFHVDTARYRGGPYCK
ncbi:MAG: extensin family protein [Rhodobacteraceae bacterium]|nr:extensin family protein [Paracoccaceae bacterium]